MRLKHFDYIRLVTAAYKRKLANQELSPLLAQSSPAKIRRECVNVYKERPRREDEQVLRAFFGPAESGKQMLQLIEGFDTDKFRPLVNYLKNGTERTDDKNLELLAWLIDFPHRPFGLDKNVLLSREELSVINETGESGRESETGELQNKTVEQSDLLKDGETEISAERRNGLPQAFTALPGNNTANRKIKMAGLVILVLVLCGAGAYMMTNMKSECMYWAGDHYEKVDCSEEENGRVFFPLHKEKMNSLRKITMTDTITEKSIGVLYYLSTDGKKEYFTKGGNHPVYITRKLRVLSQHIFDTYLAEKDVAGKDSSALQSMK